MSVDPIPLAPRTVELLHRTAEGAADAAERRELDGLIAAAPGLREEVEALREAVEALDGLPLVDPPKGMKGEILRELRRRQGASATPLKASRRNLPRLRRWRFLAVAAGLLAVAASAYFLERSRATVPFGPEPAAVAGTMGARDLRSWRVLATVPARAEGPGLLLRREGDRFALEVSLPLSGQAAPRKADTLELVWDPKALECVEARPALTDLEASNRRGALQVGQGSEAGGPGRTRLFIFKRRPGFNKPHEVLLRSPGGEYLRATIPEN